MDRIRHADLQQLLEHHEGPCVSMFIPMHLTGRDGMQDPVRLRKLADEAEEKLIEFGLRRGQAEELLAPLRDLPGDLAWQQRGQVLAFFGAPGFQRIIQTAGQVEPALYVNDHFCVLPLIPLVTDMDRFFVLSLSQNAAMLYEGDARELRPLPIAGLPRNLEEARQIENADRGETLKSGARGSMKKQSAVFQRAHGRPDVIQLELREYLRQVAEVVDRRLNGESTPLVLATVEATAPIWREVSRYKFVLDDFVAGNADHLSPAELHAKAWPLVQPALAVSRRLSERRLLEAEGAKVASSLREIVPAAISGRISTLFIDCRRSRWGQYDAASHSVVLHQQREPGDQDLVELAAVETMRNGGEVFDLRPEHEGAGEAAEALLRF